MNTPWLDIKRLALFSVVLAALAATMLLLGLLYPGLLRTPDQLGDFYAAKGDYTSAANEYKSPLHQGVAWYRSGEFEKAAQSFERLASAEARFNQGNCLVLLGKYESAVKQYDLSLERKPQWSEAIENRKLALARAAAFKAEGGDAGDQRIGADEIVFDKNAKKGGQDTEVGASQTNSKSVQELWLRKVQTKPADFLKFKFSYQASEQEDSP